ncbi:unnamed protein product [Caenorhabditis auriculariae]|uniref:F-box domain-containing protein n=1 Tax=Caenorhabditis auriculariae TaxID=2777116 RepID=A0A8S1HMB4_9PELO|nr:unnamed protein product [Caenorhabditis auriculariae]
MSFLNLRSNSRTSTFNALDLPDEVLAGIFHRCSPVDLTRCALVCHRFREVIEDEEEKKARFLRSWQRTRIFICDRRRAILEKIPTPVVSRLHRTSETMSRTSSINTMSSGHSNYLEKVQRKHNSSEMQGDRKEDWEQVFKLASSTRSEVKSTSFLADQYTDIKDSNWAFKFDFKPWVSNYEITEVFFKNFCSFLDRESTQMEMDFGPGVNSPRTSESISGKAVSPSTAISPQVSMEPRAYDRLPSNQSTSDMMFTKMDAQSEEGLRSISAGRLEHLAKILEPIRPLHLMFRDYCCYQNRPPILVFWFIKMARHRLHRLTLHNLQAVTPVDAHDVISLANIEIFNVVQPESHPNVLIKGTLLLNWLRLPLNERKKISINLTGCRELSAPGIAAFVMAWKSTAEPAIFTQFSLDGDSFRFHEIFVEIEYAQRGMMEKTNKKQAETGSDRTLLKKTLVVRHRRVANVQITLAYANDRIMLTCNEVDIPKAMPTKLARPHSFAVLNDSLSKTWSTESLKSLAPPKLLRPLSQTSMRGGNASSATSAASVCRGDGSTDDYIEQPNLVNRFIRFLAT